MIDNVVLNEVSIAITNYHEEITLDTTVNKELRKIGFDFKVKSSDYHKITTLLYQMDFQVKVPGKNLEFPAMIHSYSTSITNLYKEDEVGDFKLVLLEKV